MSINATALYPWLAGSSSGLPLNTNKPIRKYIRLPYITLTSAAQAINVLDIKLDADSCINDVYAGDFTTILSSISGNPTKAKFSIDGLSMYCLDPGGAGGTIFRYTLSEAYNPLTWAYSQQLSVNGVTGTVKDFAFSADGTKLLVLGTNSSNAIFEYTLSSAWDLSTASYTSRNYSTASRDTDMKDIRISPDGLRLLLLGNTNKRIYQFTLGSYGNLTSVTFNTELSLSSYLTNPVSSGSIQAGMCVSRDGLRVYIPYNTGISDISGAVQEIILTAPFTLSAATVGITLQGGTVGGSASLSFLDIGEKNTNGETPILVTGQLAGGDSNPRVGIFTNTDKTNLLVHGCLISTRTTTRIYYQGDRLYVNNKSLRSFPYSLNDYVDRLTLLEASGSNGKDASFLPLYCSGSGNNAYRLEVTLAASSSITNDLGISTYYSIY